MSCRKQNGAVGKKKCNTVFVSCSPTSERNSCFVALEILMRKTERSQYSTIRFCLFVATTTYCPRSSSSQTQVTCALNQCQLISNAVPAERLIANNHDTFFITDKELAGWLQEYADMLLALRRKEQKGVHHEA